MTWLVELLSQVGQIPPAADAVGHARGVAMGWQALIASLVGSATVGIMIVGGLWRAFGKVRTRFEDVERTMRDRDEVAAEKLHDGFQSVREEIREVMTQIREGDRDMQHLASEVHGLKKSLRHRSKRHHELRNEITPLLMGYDHMQQQLETLGREQDLLRHRQETAARERDRMDARLRQLEESAVRGRPGGDPPR